MHRLLHGTYLDSLLSHSVIVLRSIIHVIANKFNTLTNNLRIRKEILGVNLRQFKAMWIRSFWRYWSLDLISCFFTDSSANFFFRSTASTKIRRVDSYVAVSVLGRMKPVKHEDSIKHFIVFAKEHLRDCFIQTKNDNSSVIKKNQGLTCEQVRLRCLCCNLWEQRRIASQIRFWSPLQSTLVIKFLTWRLWFL